MWTVFSEAPVNTGTVTDDALTRPSGQACRMLSGAPPLTETKRLLIAEASVFRLLPASY